MLTTYPLLARDHEMLVAQDWHAVILDEAQTIKNPNAETTRQALRLKARPASVSVRHAVAEPSGRAVVAVRFPGAGFPGFAEVVQRALPQPDREAWRRRAADLLNKRVRPFMLRRTKEEVATELPPKTEIFDVVEMEQAQRAIYDGDPAGDAFAGAGGDCG